MNGVTVLNGGAGFIGSALARSLVEAGETVRVVDSARRLSRAKPWLTDPRIEILERDRGLHWLENCRSLVHLAWNSIPASSMENPSHDVKTNVIEALNLFQAAVNAEVECIIFASSGGAVYGNVAGFADEAVAPAPISVYGINKLCVEHYVALYAREHSVRGYSLRIANPYGPYQLVGTPIGVIANFVARTLEGKPIEIWGDGSIARDFIHIDDVTRAIVSILQQRPRSGCYNIGTGVAYSLREVATVVRQLSGCTPQIHFRHGRGFDVLRVALDASLIQRATGWSPEIELFGGIRELITQATRCLQLKQPPNGSVENEQ